MLIHARGDKEHLEIELSACSLGGPHNQEEPTARPSANSRSSPGRMFFKNFQQLGQDLNIAYLHSLSTHHSILQEQDLNVFYSH